MSDPLGLETDPLGLESDSSDEKSYAGRVFKEAAPAVGSTILDMVRAIPSGLRGASSVVGDLVAKPYTNESLDTILQRGAERFGSNMESLGSTPNDPAVQEAKGVLGEGIEHGISNIANPPSMMKFMAGTPGSITGNEVLTQLMPIPGMGLASKGLRKVIPALDPKIGKIKQLEEIQQRLDKDKADRMQRAMTPELPFADPLGLEGTERSPYHMPEEDVQRVQGELNDPRTITYPEELQPRVEGQGDLFKDPETFGGVGSRDKTNAPDLEARQMTWPGLDSGLNAERAAMNMGRDLRGELPVEQMSGRGHGDPVRPEQTTMNWDPSVTEQLESRLKPGFQRDAIDVMRSKELGEADPWKGPGKNEKGGIEIGTGKSSEYEQFKKEMEGRGIVLLDSVIRAVYEGNKPDLAPILSGHPQKHIKEVLDANPGLKGIRNQYIDDRSDEEIKDILANTVNLKDIGVLGKHVIGKIINGRFVASDHPLLSWASSNIHRIKNMAQQQAADLLHGASYKKPEPGTYNYEWKKLNTTERQQVNEIGQSFNNEPGFLTPELVQKRAEELHGHPLTDTQLRSYMDRVRINKVVLADINKFLKAEGREPIAELPNYWSPAEYDGAYLTFFKHKGTGETVKVMGSYLEPKLEKLQKEHPEYDISSVERKRQPGVDFESLEIILRQLEKETKDPAAKALAEAFRRSGFSKHGMKRRQFEGAAGTGEGTWYDPAKPLHDYERVSEEYIRNAYEYLAHRQLDKLYNDIVDITPENGPHQRARAYALESTDTARGGANKAMEAVSDVISGFIRGTLKVGTLGQLSLPRRFTNDFIKMGNRAGTTLLIGFWNFPYLTAQIFQHTFMRPAMRMLMQQKGMGNLEIEMAIEKAMFSTYNDLVRGATGDFIKDRAELEKIGAIEASFKYDYGNYATGDVLKDARSTSVDHLTGISTNQALEKHVVRKPAGLFAVKLLREMSYDTIAKDDKEIYHVAKELTDKYMVTNRYYEKAHVFSRSSDIGQALSPLQNYPTTWAGMLKEYLKHSGKGIMEGKPGHIIPLAEFMAINLMLGGLMGIIGMKEGDVLTHWLNQIFGWKIPSMTEFVMSHVKDKNVRYGLAGDMIGKATGFENGLNLGATFSAPTLTGSFAPGVNFWWNLGNAGYIGAKDQFDRATETEKREAMKGVSPRSTPIPWWNWADIERRHTPDGVPYERNAGGAAQYNRTPEDWQARRLGTYTLPEATYKTESFVAERAGQERNTRFADTKKEIVDRLLNDKRDNHDLISKMVEEGFTHDEILKGIREGLKSRLVEPQVKMQGHVKSSKQAK